MIEATQTVIDGIQYEFMPLAAKAARNQLTKLIKQLGPSWAEALDGIKSSTIDASIIDGDTDDAKTIMKVLGPIAGSLSGLVRGFSEALSPTDYDALCDVFLGRVTMETEEGRKLPLVSQNREQLFATKLLTELRILIWCLGEQYSDFFEYFGKAKTVLTSVAMNMASQFNSRSQSIGGSNASRGANVIQAD